MTEPHKPWFNGGGANKASPGNKPGISDEPRREIPTMTTATTNQRANRISVQANDQGGYTAKFHRTHKLIIEVQSQDTTYLATPGMNKTADREMFRIWICDHATEYGIQWDPADRRTESNTLPAKYTNDGLLKTSAESLVLPDIQGWLAKLTESQQDTHPILVGVETDSITPVTEYKGRVVASKYGNGNWAYSTVKIIATVLVGDSEGYVSMDVSLVSGQLKKPSNIGDLGYTYTGFVTELAKDFPSLIAKKVEIPTTTPPVEPTPEVESTTETTITPEVAPEGDTPTEKTITSEVAPEGDIPTEKTTKVRKLGAK